MVGKTTQSSTFSCVDELAKATRQSDDDKSENNLVDTHFVLLQHHEVEMTNAFIRVLSHPLGKGRLTDDVAHVFVDKRIPTITSLVRVSSRVEVQHTLEVHFPLLAQNPSFLSERPQCSHTAVSGTWANASDQDRGATRME